jgi:DNA-binding XRE family transcriptional regulator
MALRQLRRRLGVSQPRLADMIGGRTNFVSVSRWERGKIAPNPWRCNKLAEIAAKAGRTDIAGVFKLGLDKWYAVVHDDDMMTMLQIGAATCRTNGVAVHDLNFAEGLATTATLITRYLLRRFVIGGFAPVLSDGDQYRAWLELYEVAEQSDAYKMQLQLGPDPSQL